jgi:hypothetical protein
MLALSASGARLDCLRPYLYPTTGTEVYLAVDLVYAFTVGNVPFSLRPYSLSALKDRAFSWLGEEEQQGHTMLQRLLGGEDGLKNVEIPANVPVPKNTRGVNVQAWAMERELWEIKQTKANKPD